MRASSSWAETSRTHGDGRTTGGLPRGSSIVASVVASGVLVALAWAIDRAGFMAMDDALFDAIRRTRTPALDRIFRCVSWLGYNGTLVVDLALGVGLAAGRRQAWRLFAGCVVGSLALSSALKHLVARPRPGMDPGVLDRSWSFPSGHAMAAATLACVLTLWACKEPRFRWAAWAGWSFALVVGLSRVYRGAHYPSDVLAGWAGAVAWTGGLYGIAAAFARRSGS